MEITFQNLLKTVCFLGEKIDRTKEETLTYIELLRYTGSLARLNNDLIIAEIIRRNGEEIYDGESGGHPKNRS